MKLFGHVLLGVAGTLAIIVLFVQLSKQPDPQVQPPITIVTVEPVTSFYGDELWYLDYLVGSTPESISLKSYEMAEAFIARLAEMAEVIRMDK